MADWVTISSLATAGGTLVLAIATFSSVKSSNRSARVAERSLLAGLRPVLIPSNENDPTERLRFGDQQMLVVPGHGGAVEVGRDAMYFAIGLRNGGSGVAVLHGWRVRAREGETDERPELESFHRQQLDLYIPAGNAGYWLGAMRDPNEDGYDAIRRAAMANQLIQIDLLYGDHEGGQRTITRFMLSPWLDDEGDQEGKRAYTLRYWNVDRDDPR
jgi:hypothetical protein